MLSTLAITRKEARQTLRDTPTLLIALLVPLGLLALYGYALNFDIRDVRLAVQDRDHSVESREIVAAFVNSSYFDLIATVRHDREIRELLERRTATVVVVVPEGTGRRLRTGRDAPIQVLIDGENANTASIVMAYASEILRGVSAGFFAARTGTQPQPPLQVEPRVWFNPELNSTIFLVPGLIAFIAMITPVVLISLSIVREKERGTFEQVRMAPVSTWSYVMGKTVPYFVLSFISAMAILIAGMLLFDVPMRGSWLLLVAATSLFVLGALAQGLLISTVSESQQVAFQLALLSSFLPTILLSGFIFPIASMPPFVQAVTLIVPARHYLAALRGIVLKGVTADSVLPQLAALVAFAFAVAAVAALRLSRHDT